MLVLSVFGARKTAHAEKVFLFLLMTSLRFYQYMESNLIAPDRYGKGGDKSCSPFHIPNIWARHSKMALPLCDVTFCSRKNTHENEPNQEKQSDGADRLNDSSN